MQSVNGQTEWLSWLWLTLMELSFVVSMLAISSMLPVAVSLSSLLGSVTQTALPCRNTQLDIHRYHLIQGSRYRQPNTNTHTMTKFVIMTIWKSQNLRSRGDTLWEITGMQEFALNLQQHMFWIFVRIASLRWF